MLYKIISIIITFLFSVNLYAQDMQSNENSLSFDISLALKELPITLSLIGYFVVFSVLFLLIIFVLSLSRILAGRQRKRLKTDDENYDEKQELNIPGDVNAAIAMALHLHFEEMHDDEDPVLTIMMQKKSYKPWSSKLYSMTQQPVKQTRIY